MSWTFNWAEGAHAAQPSYNQFSYNGCAVGCGAVAWGILFGWADSQAASGNPFWRDRWGLYRVNGGRGGNAVAPLAMDEGVRNMIREIRDHIATFCLTGSGATFPWDMGQADRYLSGRTGTSLDTHYNSFGIHENRLRNYARSSIIDRKTPVIIGTGWLSHYPVAYGYAWQNRVVRRCILFCWNENVTDRSFYVNQGWGGALNGWITASTWFAGEIFP